MRGADGGPWGRLCALPALWVGLLYDPHALDAAWQLTRDWTLEKHDYPRATVPAQALNTPFRNHTGGDVALDVLELAHEGLVNRNRLDGVGLDESRFLKPLFQIAESGLTPAEDLLFAYERRWKGNIDPIFTEYAY